MTAGDAHLLSLKGRPWTEGDREEDIRAAWTASFPLNI